MEYLVQFWNYRISSGLTGITGLLLLWQYLGSKGTLGHIIRWAAILLLSPEALGSSGYPLAASLPLFGVCHYRCIHDWPVDYQTPSRLSRYVARWFGQVAFEGLNRLQPATSPRDSPLVAAIIGFPSCPFNLPRLTR
jgi:hypothetical protein